jgi:hypothetical protein
MTNPVCWKQEGSLVIQVVRGEEGGIALRQRGLIEDVAFGQPADRTNLPLPAARARSYLGNAFTILFLHVYHQQI